jgi:hypothetical protein
MADGARVVRLTSDAADAIVGTIEGRLPLWFEHDGVTYIRIPHQGPISDRTFIDDYWAVGPA